MARITGKSGFKLRSGNKPTFAKMGSSPANMRNFGIGKGISPYKDVDYEKMQKESAKKDPRYGKMSLEEYTAEVKRQMKSKKETGSYDAMGVYDAKGNKKDKNTEKSNVEKKNEDLSADDLQSNTEIKQKNKGKFANVLGNIAKVGVGALTGGLDAVYGTGKVQFAGGGTKLIPKDVKDKDKKERKFGETALDDDKA